MTTSLVCSMAVHAAIKADPVAYAALDYVGTQRIPADASGPAYDLEHRNCHCGGTLSRIVALHAITFDDAEGQRLYWSGVECEVDGWTRDSTDALWFASREDADVELLRARDNIDDRRVAYVSVEEMT